MQSLVLLLFQFQIITLWNLYIYFNLVVYDLSRTLKYILTKVLQHRSLRQLIFRILYVVMHLINSTSELLRVPRRCTYCCLETNHGKITRKYSRYCAVAFCYVHWAQLWTVLHVFWLWHKTASTPSEIISNRVCGIWLVIGEGTIVIIS